MDKEIEKLRALHYKCREFLDEKDYFGFLKFLELYDHDDVNLSELHTILMISIAFKNHEVLGEKITKLNKWLDKKIDEINDKKA